MAGIFFSGGLTCNLTVNAACGIQTTGDDCPALYYPPKCNVQVDPLQMNAVISEIANAINAFGNQYDCSRLDNLKTVLNRARNICDLPAFGAAPDLDDRIAGCFDESSSTITVQQLVSLVLSQAGTLCDLPQIGAIQDDDWLAGCIDGAARIVPFSAVRTAIGNQTVGFLSGAELILNFAGSGSNTFNVNGFEGFIAFVEASEGFAGFRIGNLVSGNGLIEEGNLPFSFVPPARLLPFVKKGNSWFCVFAGVAQHCADGDNIPYDGLNDGGGFQRLRVWRGVKF